MIVSRIGAFAEFPDDCCLKVDIDEYEEETLFRLLERMSQEPALGRQLGENASRYVREQHRIEDSAANYLAFIQQVMSQEPAVALAARHLQRTLLQEVARALVDLGGDEEESLLSPQVARLLFDTDLIRFDQPKGEKNT